MLTRQYIWLHTSLFQRLPHREDGQDMVEYALVCSLLTLVALGVMFLIGPVLRTTFQNVINAIMSA